eukprot:TRINITY_DN270_c0_g1_i3.p2 TRINITY_DN270_c0_g1~~TRINITY_DN270_c0_g1_i3.p2  ORF type:complete len:456 (-),score=26.41 TRINITY_DN270_c0_g1_i3:1148-2455(-)
MFSRCQIYACLLILFASLCAAQDCGGLAQECCCETVPVEVTSSSADNRLIMLGLQNPEQTGCCTDPDHVCVGWRYIQFGDGSGKLEDYKCYWKSVVESSNIEENANYKGDYIITEGTQNLQDSLADCQKSCEDDNKCNAFVYCGIEGGCANANVNVIPYKSCDLKFQLAVQDGNEPESWVTGPEVEFTSGTVDRSSPCGLEGRPCCQNSYLTEDSGVCQSGGDETVYCDYTTRDDDAPWGYCKAAELDDVCNTGYGLCGDQCKDSSAGTGCPDGYWCSSVWSNGAPGFSRESPRQVFCTEVPTDCGTAGNVCCPMEPLSSDTDIKAECQDGLVCVGADFWSTSKCWDYSECGLTGSECCPNLYAQTRYGDSPGDNLDICKDSNAYCNDDKICVMNADNCGQQGATCCRESYHTCCYISPTCDGNYGCDVTADVCE